jgi:sugar lactone lactonase YvrE
MMMNNLLVLLEVLVAAVMLSSAVGVVRGSRRATLLLARAPSTRIRRALMAVVAGLPGVGMIAATTVPFIAFFVSLLSITVTAVFAAASKFRGGGFGWAASTVVIVASVGVAILQPLGLKVLSLPKADVLPYEPVGAQVVKTYAEGIGFESVRAGPDGVLYLAANTGLDFTTGEYYRHARGQIFARRPDGSERVIFTTPMGSTAGVMAIAPDATVYMTSNGRQPGIWRIGQNGGATKIANLPAGAWPNGLDFGPDGMLYSPDSSLAQVWRVDPRDGRFSVALRDKRLAARPFIALAPGANGLHFEGRDMIITVSDSTEVLKYRLGDDRKFGSPSVIARGIPGDDFAIGRDGSLFVTTHPYDTVVRVYPDGRRAVVADARQQIVGATDATFGRGLNDRDTLYVATDGGAFAAGAKARGQLVALSPYR